MILPKRVDGFFPEMKDLPLLEVTAEMGLWYGLKTALYYTITLGQIVYQ